MSSPDDSEVPSKSTGSRKRPFVSSIFQNQEEGEVSGRKRMLKTKDSDGDDEENEIQVVDPVSLLPIELQYCVTKYLTTKDILNGRLVSFGWKNLMDSLYAHDVVLDYEKGFQGKLDISMKNCKMMSLGKVNCRFLFINSSVEPKSVTICREFSKWNLYDLNNNWNNLVELDLGWRSMAAKFLFTMIKSSSSKQFLPQLCSLKIGLPNFNSLTSTNNKIIKSNGEFIFSQRFINLHHLSINFIFNPSAIELIPIVLTFIRRHSKSIRTLEVSMLALSYQSPVNHPTNNSYILLSEPYVPIANFNLINETLLNSIKYQYIPNGDANERDIEEWMNFLADESPGTKLSRIITDKIMNYSLRSIDFYGGMISEASRYITELQLSNLTLYNRPSNNPLDAKVFESLSNLEKLILKRNPVLFSSNFPPGADTPIEIINLTKLPSSLKHLSVQGLAGDSRELNKMMINLKKLQILNFSQDSVNIPINLDTGFDLRTMEKVIRHPQLKEAIVSLARFISSRFCINFYNQLMTDFNWTSVHCSPGPGVMSQNLNRPKITMSKHKITST